jgi:hypothetical protein
MIFMGPKTNKPFFKLNFPDAKLRPEKLNIKHFIVD